MVTKAFYEVMELLACASRGVPFAGEELDIAKIYAVAKSQGCWSIIFPVIQKLYEAQKIKIEPAVFEQWNNTFLYTMSKEYARKVQINRTVKTLEQAGISCCILKGDILANLYAMPESRLSSDTDILIDPAREKESVGILEKLGYTVEPRDDTTHHFGATHPVAGLVEIHVKMYGDKTREITFNRDIHFDEPMYTYTTAYGMTYKTLGITDNMIFLLLHFIKHFISSGIGIRQLNDLVLYMEHFAAEIDWERVDALLRDLRYFELIGCVVEIARKYLKSDFLRYPDHTNRLEEVLADMENGGIFGGDDAVRIDFYQKYLQARYEADTGKSYSNYQRKNIVLRCFYNAFPGYRYMCKLFPELQEKPYLLPWTWVKRFFRIVRRKTQKTSTNDPLIQKRKQYAEARMALLKDLDMF